jgi:hypothetical protein
MQHKKIKSIILFAMSLLLFSFSTNWGGDSYQIYLNKKLMLKEYVSQGHAAQTFSLDKGSYNEEVDIYYSHCGQVGKNRTISIKDGNNRLVKELHYPDFNGKNSGMSFKVSDFLNWDKRNGVDQLNIYYSSLELTNGRLLASIMLGIDSKSKP